MLLHTSARRLAAMSRVVTVPVNHDNYAYLLVDEATKHAFAVDPAEPSKLIDAARREGVTITGILTTHHHADHAGGNEELVSDLALKRVIGGDDRCDAVTEVVGDGAVIELGQTRIRCLATPCHTSSSISYYIDGTGSHDPIVFTGDTLFVAGCGRFFEGTAEQMLNNMRRVYGSLPPATRVYPGHEYTVANLHFAAHVEPENADIRQALSNAIAQRKRKEATVPSSLQTEAKINPFMRLESSEAIRKATNKELPVEIMQALRAMKNEFKL